MPNSYPVPVSAQQSELIIKRSRFITNVAHAPTVDVARRHLADIRRQFPDAGHHCWAHVAGAPDDTDCMAKNDDGEPQGTAGKPMLNVLLHSGIGQISVVVTRYFGGVKLGAGGLVRAYTQCVSQALQILDTQAWVLMREVELKLPYSLVGALEYWLSEQKLVINDKVFDEAVKLRVGVPEDRLHEVCEALQSFGQGKVKIDFPE